MEQIVIFLLMVLKLLNLKEIVATTLRLGNISEDWSVDNLKSTGFDGYVYDFSVDYDAIAVHDILHIQKHLMKKINMI